MIDPVLIARALKELASFMHGQMSDPVKDKQRIGRLDSAFLLAVAGNDTPQVDMNNMSGRAYIDLIAADAVEEDGGTAAGSKVAKAYALVQQVRLRVAGR